MKRSRVAVFSGMAAMVVLLTALMPANAGSSQPPTLTQIRAGRKVLEARLELSRKRDRYTNDSPYFVEQNRRITLYLKATTPQALALAGRQMQPALESEKADLELRLIELKQTHTDDNPLVVNSRTRLDEINHDLQVLKEAGKISRQKTKRASH